MTRMLIDEEWIELVRKEGGDWKAAAIMDRLSKQSGEEEWISKTEKELSKELISISPYTVTRRLQWLEEKEFVESRETTSSEGQTVKQYRILKKPGA